ncbi:MAG: Maf family nucleotide pyrophosphatase [Saprospiraceae bacterium]
MQTLPILEIPILLASQSPRRSQLLLEVGFNVQVVEANYEEIVDPNLDVHLVAEKLAVEKANAYQGILDSHQVLCTADTIVLTGDLQILGKPKDILDAKAMLRKLSGTQHKVITGVCLRSGDKLISFSDTAIVTLTSMSDIEIDYYIDKFMPLDKAGAYGIQEWIGHCKISAINGSYLTIMGLPVHLIYENLGLHFLKRI